MALTLKSWLHKSTSTNTAKYSAYGFLNQYREFLTTGELAEKVSPIIAKLDVERAKALSELRDTEAMTRASLLEIQNAVIAHITAVSAAKQEAVLEQAQAEPAAASTSKKLWIASVVDANWVVQTRVKPNGDVEDLIKKFEKAEEADRWLTRRLFESHPSWLGFVDHATLNVHTMMDHDEAVAVILKKKKQSVLWQRSKTTKTLGFQHKATEKRVSFSRG
jgi:hypothetical protein